MKLMCWKCEARKSVWVVPHWFWVKVPDTKPEDLSSNLRMYTVERTDSTSPSECCVTSTEEQRHKHAALHEINNVKKKKSG